MAKPGRPRIVETPEEFDRRVDEYVEDRRSAQRPITFTGMALFLGFVDRRSLYDYQDLPGFSPSVKRARAMVEAQYEENLHGQAVAGSIFALKNHGWTDRQEIAVTEAPTLHVILAGPAGATESP